MQRLCSGPKHVAQTFLTAHLLLVKKNGKKKSIFLCLRLSHSDFPKDNLDFLFYLFLSVISFSSYAHLIGDEDDEVSYGLR